MSRAGRVFARRTLGLLLGLAFLCGSPQVAAQGGTITEQGASLVYGATHWSSAPQADLLGVGATDPLVEAGWWYRASR